MIQTTWTHDNTKKNLHSDICNKYSLTQWTYSKPASIAPGSSAKAAGLGGWATGGGGAAAGTRARDPIGIAISCSLMNSFNL